VVSLKKAGNLFNGNLIRVIFYKQKNDFVTVTNICDTDNHALLLYRLTASVEITITLCRLYYFLVTMKFF